MHDMTSHFDKAQSERDAQRIRLLIAAANDARYLELRGIDRDANKRIADEKMAELKQLGVAYAK